MKKTLFKIALVGFTLATLYACKKDFQDANTVSNVAASATSSDGSLMPSIGVNGILKFNSFQHYDDYMYYLATTATNDMYDYAGNIIEEEDDKLLFIENTLGFSSLRAVNAQNFEILNEEGWEDYTQIPSGRTIGSNKFEESTLTPLGAVIIDDTMYVYMNQDVVVSFPESEVSYLDAIASVKSEYTDGMVVISDAYSLADLKEAIAPFDIDNKFQVSDANKTLARSSAGSYHMDYYSGSPKCTYNGFVQMEPKIKSYELGLSAKTPNATDIFKISWGDGTVTTHTWAQLSSTNRTATHTYSAPGNYKIEVEITTTALGGGANSYSVLRPIGPSRFIEVENQCVHNGTQSGTDVYVANPYNSSERVKGEFTKKSTTMARNFYAQIPI